MDAPKKNTALSFSEFPAVSTEEWEAIISRDLKGADYKETLLWKTGEGIDVLPIYRSEHLNNLPHLNSTSNDATGDWDIKEYIKAATAEQANKQALDALEKGASGLFFDIPADAISSEKDVSNLFKDILLDIIKVHFSPQAISEGSKSALNAFIKNSGFDGTQLFISTLFDPFEQAIHTGTLLSKEEIEQTLLSRLSDYGPALGVHAAGYGNKGATIVQQLAFALATAHEYLAHANKDQITDIAKSIHFNFSVSSSYFPEIAKLRAFRILWQQILNTYELNRIESYVSVETALWNKSTMDANNNILRGTTEAMSAAIGGCNAIMVRPFDELYKEHNGFSQRIARNIQHILLEESYLNKVSDPSQGSYYLEVITDALAQKAWSLFQEIESKGGFHACIEDGFIQDSIIKSQQAAVGAVQDGTTSIIGVNKHPKKDEVIPELILEEIHYAFAPTSFQSVARVPTVRIAEAIEQGGAS